MNDALFVRCLERLNDLPGNRQRFIDGNWPARDKEVGDLLNSLCSLSSGFYPEPLSEESLDLIGERIKAPLESYMQPEP